MSASTDDSRAVLEAFFYTNSEDISTSAFTWAMAFLGLAIGVGIGYFLQSYFFGIIAARMTLRVRSDTFRHALSLNVGFYDHKKNGVGAMTSKLASDAAMMKAAICDRLSLASQNLATIAAGLIIAFIASWKVAAVTFSLFPMLVLAGAVEMIVMSGMANSDQKSTEESFHTLNEAVHGIRTVVAFGMQESLKELYIQQLQGPLIKSQKKGCISGLGFGFSQATQFFAMALTFWYGSNLVADGEITIRELNQALFGILMTAMAIGQSFALAPDVAKGSAAVNSIFGLLDLKSEIDPFSDDGNAPSTLMGDIDFEDVEFSYPTRPNLTVLKEFSLQIKRGQTVAFVGTSGSGKSTLVSLTERFYNPSRGTVRIDGVDVSHLNIQWLRSQIGIVSQEPDLFKDSVLENIRKGKLDATDEECMQAAKLANAHEFILRFPDGYNTDLHSALAVSGGQKQRIAIARALLRNPKILLLDEATSALDEESQSVVQEALDRLLEKSSRTTIVVAHRLSTIRNADMIVVLQHGVVVEQGSFAELTSNPDGPFSSLLKAQNNLPSES